MPPGGAADEAAAHEDAMMSAMALFPNPVAAAVALVAVLLGATVQGTLGFGMGLMAIPVLALFVPEQLPQSLVLVSLPHTVLLLWRERRWIRPTQVSWLLVGRLVGVVPGLAVLASFTTGQLQTIFALVTLAAVVLMAADRIKVRLSCGSQLAAGTLSGLVGTAAGLGGPPVALLYADGKGHALRTSLALVMVVGNVTALFGYWAAGRLTAGDVMLSGLFLAPAMLGLLVGFCLHDHLEGPRLRAAVLLLVATSAVVLLGRGMTG